MTRPRVLVATFGAAHGIRGEVRVKSFTADPAAFATYGPLQAEGGTQMFEIAGARPLKDDLFIVRIKDVNDRTAAEALNGTGLTVARELLPPAQAGEYYYSDLVGLKAVTDDGAAIGTVVAVQNYGAGDILEIKPEAGGDTLLLPFLDAVVRSVDLDAGRIVLNLPQEVAGEPDASHS
ncbi:ribosome maturation factor RimM [Methylovirgula sp. 4M-Z18]|uniref:ribosome maturation factor RimM n=1 Tax=Methylovirgula sp. 4M-Z18 TaxID=2293567 RepID=UPI000E2E724B|nr:ribosome maturation factor RimM [Methylovirgula sp. 4M-Z18]RFB79127.1 ribosome maturation factor RimM [Methylovirgula sp. 4M-Z18]